MTDNFIKIPITVEMLAEAEADKARVQPSVGYGTRPASEDRDIIGSLAHQAVEIYLTQIGMEFKSSRKLDQLRGDKGDIFIKDLNIDVKGIKTSIDTFTGFYGGQCRIFEKDIAKFRAKGINHLLFAVVSLYTKEVFLIGIIELNDYVAKKISFKSEWGDNNYIAYDKLKTISEMFEL